MSRPLCTSEEAIANLDPTVVFDTYWDFAARRQEVYFARLRGQDAPWSVDPIISSFRFTNAYRAADRVSQYLIRHVIYNTDYSNRTEDVLFRILLFKIFNRIETWELLIRTCGPPELASYSFEKYDKVLSRALEAGERIYSAAYIMPSPHVYGHRRKHRNHLLLLQYMMDDGLTGRLGRARTMGDGYTILRAYPSLGNFLAYQFVIDINYSELTNFCENDFVVPGPGAVDGMRKAFRNATVIDGATVIQLTTECQDEQFARLGIRFLDLFGRRLSYIDCQNLYCEVSKYSRVAYPEYPGASGRTRIKQRFRQHGELPTPWFPPKWGINARVAEFLRGRSDSWN